jgi:hypothetical protein
MRTPAILQRYLDAPAPVRQGVAAAAWLLFGLCVLPACIFLAGITLLGRYEGAGLAHTYSSILTGLGAGSAAAWTVVLGPYVLFLLFKILSVWWRAAAKWAP